MTQEEVAFAAEFSIRHYQSLESGRLNPSFLTLRAVAAALDTSIALLVRPAENEF
jgi:transcriptional regulator with XRE-family HTH domain